MIIRVFRVRIRPGMSDEWQEKVERLSIPFVQSGSGLIAFYPGKPIEPDSRDFTMVTIWKDLQSLKAWAGDDWNRPIILGEEVPLVEESWLSHYETFGLERE